MQMFGNSIKVGLQKVFTSLFCKSWINCYGVRAHYPSNLILRFWYENTEVIGKGKTTIFYWWGTFGKASVHLKLTFKFKFKNINYIFFCYYHYHYHSPVPIYNIKNDPALPINKPALKTSVITVDHSSFSFELFNKSGACIIPMEDTDLLLNPNKSITTFGNGCECMCACEECVVTAAIIVIGFHIIFHWERLKWWVTKSPVLAVDDTQLDMNGR